MKSFFLFLMAAKWSLSNNQMVIYEISIPGLHPEINGNIKKTLGGL